MPRRPPLILLGLLLAGCASSAPELPVVDVAPGTAAPGCAALIAALPASLGEKIPARRVRPSSGSTAAWGSPPITLRCGVPRGSIRDDRYVFDSVAWLVHDDGATHRWTTADRRVPVEVVIPDAYDAQAELLITLSPALSRP